MKKILSFITITALSLSLIACSSSSNEDIKEPTNVSTNNVVTEDITDNDKTIDEVVEESTVDISIEESVLVDESGIKITAKELNVDEFWGSELKLLIENNSGSDLTFQCRNASVNGYMVETMMSTDVVNGKKANDSLTFMPTGLEPFNSNEIADMEFSIHVFDTESWDTYLDTPQISLKTSIYEDYEYKFDDSGDLVYNENGIKAVIKGLIEDESIFGPSIVVYLENNSNENITVQSRDVSINGFMVDTIFSSEVLPGKHSIDTITFFSEDLEENDITTIENIEISLHIFNTDSWDTIVDTDVISIEF